MTHRFLPLDVYAQYEPGHTTMRTPRSISLLRLFLASLLFLGLGALTTVHAQDASDDAPSDEPVAEEQGAGSFAVGTAGPAPNESRDSASVLEQSVVPDVPRCAMSAPSGPTPRRLITYASARPCTTFSTFPTPTSSASR